MHCVDADDVAVVVPVRRVMDRLPLRVADRLRKLELGRHDFAGQHAVEQRLQHLEARVAGDVGNRAPGQVVAAQAQPFLVVSVQKPVAIFAIDVRHARRHVVHDEPQLAFRRAQRFLRLLQAMDVVHQHERAVDFAGRTGIRHDADRHPAARAVRAGHEAVERRRLALERARQHRLRALVDALPDDVAQPQVADLIDRQAEVLEERPIDVMAALVAIDVRDGRGHAVHDRAKLRFARGQCILRELEIGDVVADDVLAAHRAVEIEIGHAARADPARAADDVDHRALVGQRLALHRAVAVGRERLRAFDAEHFLGLLAEHFVAAQSIEIEERLVDEHVAAFRVEIDDGLGNVVGEKPELLFARGELLLRLLEIVDVVFGAVEPAHLAGRIEIGRHASVHPASLAVGVLADALVFDVLARLRALQHRTQESRDVGRHHLERRLAVDLVLRLAHPVRERLVHERVVQALVEIGDRTGNVVGEQAQLLLLRLQCIANANVVLDVVPHDECAADAPAHFAIGKERHAHPAQFAGRAPLAPLVGDRRTGERALDVALHLGERVRRQEVAQRMAEQIVGRHADPVGERLVGEAQAQLPVEVQDRQADAVGDEPQPVLALARLELEALQVVDIAVGREKAADVPLLVAIGIVVDADPDRLAARHGELPFVAGALAAERCLDVRAIELIAFASQHLDDLAAEDFVRALAEPVQQRLVGEAVALVEIDVRERRAERVELALRQREQRPALDRIADRRRDGCEIEAADRAGEGHGRSRLFPRRRRTAGRPKPVLRTRACRIPRRCVASRGDKKQGSGLSGSRRPGQPPIGRSPSDPVTIRVTKKRRAAERRSAPARPLLPKERPHAVCAPIHPTPANCRCRPRRLRAVPLCWPC